MARCPCVYPTRVPTTTNLREEFIRFMRLFREKQLARVKMVFTKQADPHVDPPTLAAAQAGVNLGAKLEAPGGLMK